jgi:hypothetical protein
MITFQSPISSFPSESAADQKPLGAQGISHNIVPANLDY